MTQMTQMTQLDQMTQEAPNDPNYPNYPNSPSQVKYINTDKHILRFAKNNRTAARKAFCLIVICVSCSSGLKAGRSDFCIYIYFSNSIFLEYF